MVAKAQAQPPETLEEYRDRLARQLKEVNDEIAAAKQAVRDSVKPDVRYTIQPGESHRWDRVWDDAVVPYHIGAKVLNREALEEVGAQVPQEGGMRYLFNTATGKLIGYTGGGNIYLGDNQRAFDQVSAFLQASPEGGDITDIVESTRGRD